MDGHKQAKAYGEVWRGPRLWNQYCSHQIIHLRASQTVEPTNPPHLYPRPGDNDTGGHSSLRKSCGLHGLV